MLGISVGKLIQEGRVGRIEISYDLLKDADFHIMSLVMAKVVVLETISSLYNNKQTFICVSPAFEPKKEGEKDPYYGVEVSIECCNDYKVRLVRL